jgi:hypothetical protein
MQEYEVESIYAGQAIRSEKKLYAGITSNLTMEVMVHMIFLHSVIERFAKDWKNQF